MAPSAPAVEMSVYRAKDERSMVVQAHEYCDNFETAWPERANRTETSGD
jgi:hypothetical protein